MTAHQTARFIAANTQAGTHPLVPEIKLHLADRITPIWQASERELEKQGIEPPYWAFCWPGGAATARFILDRPGNVQGRDVLDLAAGCGIAALAAAKASAAKVTANEIDPTALAAIALNAETNGVTLALSGDDLLEGPPPARTLILAGDVCYQRDMAARMTDWLVRAVAAGSEVWLADPGRAYLPETGLAEITRFEVPTSLELEDREMRETVIYRLTGS